MTVCSVGVDTHEGVQRECGHTHDGVQCGHTHSVPSAVERNAPPRATAQCQHRVTITPFAAAHKKVQIAAIIGRRPVTSVPLHRPQQTRDLLLAATVSLA